ncbi:hypothetical protein K435DRAFT_859262 [Dendrothele bispora CBS 962.96]|uniref:Uncharacterized protein n=1 Tax=Dendrothele bispora (strain CBS 962.96) TaxID=1314807 RepID=A0A4S8M1N7_DENBC|nr:hypothetical protein K435DRAFT_859262 [Dendrothele bispora CBS 962.96]
MHSPTTTLSSGRNSVSTEIDMDMDSDSTLTRPPATGQYYLIFSSLTTRQFSDALDLFRSFFSSDFVTAIALVSAHPHAPPVDVEGLSMFSTREFKENYHEIIRGDHVAQFFITAHIADHASLNRGPSYFSAGRTTDAYTLKEDAVRRTRYKAALDIIPYPQNATPNDKTAVHSGNLSVLATTRLIKRLFMSLSKQLGVSINSNGAGLIIEPEIGQTVAVKFKLDFFVGLPVITQMHIIPRTPADLRKFYDRIYSGFPPPTPPSFTAPPSPTKCAADNTIPVETNAHGSDKPSPSKKAHKAPIAGPSVTTRRKAAHSSTDK